MRWRCYWSSSLIILFSIDDMSLTLLESTLRSYALDHRKDYSGVQINRYPISREFLGIPIPQLRVFQHDRLLTMEERRDFFHQTGVNECQTWLLFAYEKMKADVLLPHTESLLWLIESCDNWWISDTLSSIYTRLLDHDRSLYQTLAQRNTSDNLRKRRQSLVSVYYYARGRKNPLPYVDALVLLEPLLYDSDYYVQKAVGRTLREMYHLYPEQTLAWIRLHVSDIHPRAWQAATEKLTKDDKGELKRQRVR